MNTAYATSSLSYVVGISIMMANKYRNEAAKIFLEFQSHDFYVAVARFETEFLASPQIATLPVVKLGQIYSPYS